MLIRIILLALMVSMTGTVHAVERLFTSHADRQLLDDRRLGRTQHVEQQVKLQRQSLQLDGVVRIDHMTPNIWLNGSPSDLKDEPYLKLGTHSSSRSIELELIKQNLKVKLKPGQTLDLLTGKQEEAFNGRQTEHTPYNNTNADSNDQAVPQQSSPAEDGTL